MAMQIPNRLPSSTARFAGIGGAIAAVAMGIFAIGWPELYERVPPGFEGGIAGLVAFLFAWAAKERVYEMRERDK